MVLTAARFHGGGSHPSASFTHLTSYLSSKQASMLLYVLYVCVCVHASKHRCSVTPSIIIIRQSQGQKRVLDKYSRVF
jgi:hypothetical protein